MGSYGKLSTELNKNNFFDQTLWGHMEHFSSVTRGSYGKL